MSDVDVEFGAIPDLKRAFDLADILLFGVGYLSDRDEGSQCDQGKISSALKVDRKRLGRAFETLHARGLIQERKGGVCGKVLSGEGMRKYGTLYEHITTMTFDPEIHRCEGNLGSALRSFKDPANIMRIVHCVMAGVDLDVVALNHEERLRRGDSSEMLLLKELVDSRGDLDQPFEGLVNRLMLGGKVPEDLPSIEPGGSIVDELVTAELLRRQLKENEAFTRFVNVLRNRSGPDSAYRIFAVVGMINCIKVLEGHEAAMKEIGQFLSVTTHPPYRVMLMKCQADILSYSDHHGSIKLYLSCLKAINRLGLPQLHVAILNNIGVMHFIMEDWKEAKKYWKKSLRISRENYFEWMEAIINLNLSDLLAKEGKHARAKRILGGSKKFFMSVNDTEGLSGYHFNMALVHIEEGNRELALKHFVRYEEFPIRYREKREEERKAFKERFGEKGWDLDGSLDNADFNV